MKNGGAFALVILILLVVGCSCDKLAELGNKKGSTNSGTSSTPVSNTGTSSSTGKYDLTLAQYNQIKDGMTLADAERILGGPGTEMSSTTAAGTTYSTLKWEGEGFSSVILSFKNNRVYSRVQVGLK